MATSRLQNKLPANNGCLVLVLGAHPDDGVLGAGGLAASVATGGGGVVFITATLGELGGDPLTRQAEDVAATRILGADWQCGELRDGDIAARAAITLVEDAIQRFTPNAVLVHHPRDTHQDHVTLSRATIAACRQVANLLFYEGPTTQGFCPSLVLDISSVWPQKLEAIRAHESQRSRADLIEWSDTVSRFRAWPRYSGGRCEAFSIHHGDLSEMPKRAPERRGRRGQ